VTCTLHTVLVYSSRWFIALVRYQILSCKTISDKMNFSWTSKCKHVQWKACDKLQLQKPLIWPINQHDSTKITKQGTTTPYITTDTIPHRIRCPDLLVKQNQFHFDTRVRKKKEKRTSGVLMRGYYILHQSLHNRFLHSNITSRYTD